MGPRAYASNDAVQAAAEDAVSAPAKNDYPEWTHYSHGNPDGERRVYCGWLLYAFSDSWHVSNGPGPFKCHEGFANREDAKRAAEKWAEEQP